MAARSPRSWTALRTGIIPEDFSVNAHRHRQNMQLTDSDSDLERAQSNVKTVIHRSRKTGNYENIWPYGHRTLPYAHRTGKESECVHNWRLPHVVVTPSIRMCLDFSVPSAKIEVFGTAGIQEALVNFAT